MTPIRRFRGRTVLAATLQASLFFLSSSVALAGDVCRAPRDAASLARVWHSPCADSDEASPSLELPLPVAGAVMAFRPILTPGRQIFSRCVPEGRSLIFGDPQDPFAQERRRAVTGAFRTEEGWRSWLAKYELTVGQAAAILAGDPETGAEGSLAAGVAALSELAAPDAEVEAQDAAQALRALSEELAETGAAAPMEAMRALARPAAGLSPGDFDALAQRYSEWCYRNGACRALLQEHASTDGAPGSCNNVSTIGQDFTFASGATIDGAPISTNGTYDRKVWKGGGGFCDLQCA